MSLTLKFVASVVDKDAEQLLLQDTTGAYHVTTNPTGYGVENSFITPSYTFLKYKTWTDDAWATVLLSSAQLANLLAGTLEVTPTEVGSSGDSFPDGVDQLQMIPMNDSGVNGTFTEGSKIVTLSTTSWDPDDYVGLFDYIAGINGSDEDETGVLEVDTDETNNTTQLTLKEAYDGPTVTTNLFYGPLKDLKVLVNKAAEACIAQTLAANSPLNCNCVNDIPKINKMIQWRFVADVLFNCDDFVGAHNTLVQLNKVCTQNLSTCNVHF